ncbi:conserved hypothetical protein [Anaeromyxobacter dehalogenans 2CP-1]|uniref:Uncharacterized protein n=1 Tax=Anaeromyxobacter dehalogenans (strain ATCC BAA-258 / DSM 21875 / 2CP-1) TaxID=455488 RepID=B8JC23_ANAD2|nr:hypothetical protein [Anaeromyxobacter dehalogenans]ACL63945.1 conserved hypothetical protein [Anaeromyxobacter dehalogenans 2CP-1]
MLAPLAALSSLAVAATVVVTHPRTVIVAPPRPRAVVVVPARPPPPPPPPPPMARREAVERGYGWCGASGYACVLVEAHPRGPVWDVHFRARRPGAAGPLRVTLDRQTRALVEVVEPGPKPPPAR